MIFQLIIMFLLSCIHDYLSDGMSRTGVFIAAMCEVERVKVEGEVDIFQTIKAMRKKRPHMVYNKVGPSHTYVQLVPHAKCYWLTGSSSWSTHSIV